MLLSGVEHVTHPRIVKINIVNNTNYRDWVVLGDPQLKYVLRVPLVSRSTILILAETKLILVSTTLAVRAARTILQSRSPERKRSSRSLT